MSSAPKPAPSLNSQQESAYDLMANTLRSWGLDTLLPDLKNLIVKGDTSPDTLSLALSQTDAYKKRFAGNEARRKEGLPELNPAQYIAVEEGYRNLASQYGLPASYLDKATTDKMIGGGVSPAEAQDRIQSAADIVWNAPPEAMQQWNQWYGGGHGGVISAMLDPTKAAPLVERQAVAAEIGGSALVNGLQANKGTSERLAQEGVTLADARKTYAQIAQRMGVDQAASARFGMQFGQAEEEKASFEGDAQATQKQNSLYAQEASLFGGHGGGTAATGDPGSNY